ncbi:MAG: prepilin peptidase [Candidatus Omnitrophica bacterium]|nr:prepilin peptidase [Candidatus Omnitrophota bacterium]
MVDFFIFILGICIGSFLNVCIHRIPREESVVQGRSKCTQCGKQIAWYDNFPMVSYLVLRAKCRSCGKRFSFRYFLVEFLTGFLWLYLWKLCGPSPLFGAGIVLFSILVSVTFTDLETGYIPDKLTLPGMLVGLGFSAVFPSLLQQTFWAQGLMRSCVGLLAGGGILLLLGLAGNFIFKKETMGGGDIKLLAMLGAFLGIGKVLFVFFMAPMLSVPFALYTKLIKKEETMPFGPFIAAAGALAFIYGDYFLANYFYGY